MSRRGVIVGVLTVAAAVAPIGLEFFGHWSVGQVWLPYAFGSLLPTLALFMCLPGPGLFGLALAYSGVSAWNRRWAAAGNGLIVAAGAAAGMFLFFSTTSAAMKVRIGGFAHLAAEAAPIVTALHRYESRMGRPPSALAELVPADLPKLPWWSGRLQYYRSDDGSTMDLYGNPWALRVNAGFAMGFDTFVYFPKQNYPTYFYGGGPERVGTWAYVHE